MATNQTNPTQGGRKPTGTVATRFLYPPVTMTFAGDILKALEGLDVAQRKMFLGQMRQLAAANRQRRNGNRRRRNDEKEEAQPNEEAEDAEQPKEKAKLNFKKAVQAEATPEAE